MMLQPVTGRGDVLVRCIAADKHPLHICTGHDRFRDDNHMVKASDAYADLEGPAFQAYYCTNAVREQAFFSSAP